MPQTMVREYNNVNAFQKDAQQLARQGWTVQSQAERTQSSGLGRCCTLGLFALVLKPQPHIVVTYIRP